MARPVVTAIPSGVRAVLKSDGVAAALGRQAASAAARCESMAAVPGAQYVGEAVQRGYTAGGLVRVANGAAKVDNLRNNTLRKGVGI